MSDRLGSSANTNLSLANYECMVIFIEFFQSLHMVRCNLEKLLLELGTKFSIHILQTIIHTSNLNRGTAIPQRTTLQRYVSLQS